MNDGRMDHESGVAQKMKRPAKRSFTIAGHRTSVSLEEPFWQALKEIAREKGLSRAELVRRIDASRKDIGLSSAIRLYVLAYYRDGARVAPEDR